MPRRDDPIAGCLRCAQRGPRTESPAWPSGLDGIYISSGFMVVTVASTS
jgi:hypothetical protein